MVTKRKIIDILTDIVGVCGFVGSFSALALGVIPTQYAATAIAVFAAVAVGGSAVKKLIDIISGIPIDDNQILTIQDAVAKNTVAAAPVATELLPEEDTLVSNEEV